MMDDAFQNLMKELTDSLGFADWNSWSKEFIESLKDKYWVDLNECDKIKVLELHKDLIFIHIPINERKKKK